VGASLQALEHVEQELGYAQALLIGGGNGRDRGLTREQARAKRNTRIDTLWEYGRPITEE
jgi:hypothetical protein